MTKFAVVGDTHIGWSPREEVNLRRVVDIINKLNIDFTIQLGDVADRESQEQSYVIAKQFLDRLKKPYYTIRGNHDFGANYNKYFGESQYFFEVNPFSFVFLDCLAESPYWRPFDWSQLNPSNQVIVCIHTTPHPSGSWAPTFPEGLQSKLESLGRVVLVLSGDFHNWHEYLLNGITYIVVDGTGGGGGVYLTPEEGSKTDGYFGLCETRDNQITLTKISFLPSFLSLVIPLLLAPLPVATVLTIIGAQELNKSASAR